VKRPGLTQFIEKLSKYYEIVIFTENDIGVMSDLIAAIDPEGCAPHRFGSAQAEKRNYKAIGFHESRFKSSYSH
jgi:hypothetical protein